MRAWRRPESSWICRDRSRQRLDRHWTTFQDLVLNLDLRGGDVTDAWFAALAMEQGCEWTADAGFARFPGLRLRLFGER